MKYLRRSLFVATIIISAATEAFAVNCSGYNDCDFVAACGIVDALQTNQTSFSSSVATALGSKGNLCLNYPDLFAKNIDFNLPPRVIIDWNFVRQQMMANDNSPEPLTDLKEEPKYQDVYGLLITESPWWSWGGAVIGGVVGAGICIGTAGVGCLAVAPTLAAKTAITAGVAKTAIVAGAAGVGAGAGGIISSFYRMKDQETVGKLPKWQSNWRGCFNLCGDYSDANDLLTIKVLRPVLGGTDRYCISKDLYYTLHNMTTNEPVFFKKEQIEKIKSGLRSIADQGYCDSHFNDADAYIIKYNVDSAYVSETGKQELNYTITVASEAIRLDD